jgi:hypothetical protein
MPKRPGAERITPLPGLDAGELALPWSIFSMIAFHRTRKRGPCKPLRIAGRGFVC